MNRIGFLYLLLPFIIERGYSQFFQFPPPIIIAENLAHTFSCAPGFRLVVADAGYSCSLSPGIDCRRINCNSPTAGRIITQNCHCKSQCTIAARNDVFGDPCPGLNKTAHFRYSCLEARIWCPFSITSRTTSTTRMATTTTTTKVSTTTQATPSNMESTTFSRGILLTSNTKTRSTTQRIRPTRRTTPTQATSPQSRRSTTRSTRSTTQSTISTTQSTRSTTQSIRSTRLISTTTRSSKTIRPPTLSSRTTETNTKRIRTDMPTTEIVNTEASTILMTSLPVSTEKTAETTLLINAKPSTSLGILSPVTTLLTPQINMSMIPLTTLLPIVVGVAVLLVLAGMIIFFCCKRKRLTVTATSNMNNNKPTSSQNGQEPCKNAWSNSGPNLVANVLYAPGRFNDVDVEGEDETYNKLYFLPQKKSNKQNEQRNNYSHIEITNNIPIMFNEKEQVYNELYFSKESAKTNYKSSATSRNPHGAFKIKERIEKTRKNQTNFPKSANSLSHNDSNHALLNDEVNIYNVPYNL